MYLLRVVLGALAIMPAMVLSKNSTFTNPMLPGWHSDPSCTFVAEEDNSFFCATSSFLTFPGMPIYTSKDLLGWRLASHVFSRTSQVPQIGNTTVQNGGLWATTIRYHDGKFYAIVSYTPEVGNSIIMIGLENLFYHRYHLSSRDSSLQLLIRTTTMHGAIH